MSNPLQDAYDAGYRSVMVKAGQAPPSKTPLASFAARDTSLDATAGPNKGEQYRGNGPATATQLNDARWDMKKRTTPGFKGPSREPISSIMSGAERGLQQIRTR